MFDFNNPSLNIEEENNLFDNKLLSINYEEPTEFALREQEFENEDLFPIESYNEKNTYNLSPIIDKDDMNFGNFFESTQGITKLNRDNNNNNKEINNNDKKQKNKKSKNQKCLGRKRKKDQREVLHSKFDEDNRKRKIKTYIINYTLNLINSNIHHSNKKFLKIDKVINENINKDFNMKLMNTDFYHILSKYEINGRYRSIKDKMINVSLLKEIYEKNKDIEAIKLLNTKYIDMIKFMRENDLEKFKNYLFNKAIKDGDTEENSEKYVNLVLDLLFSFEENIENIKGRKRNKENKKIN